jgi:hypothetical protein
VTTKLSNTGSISFNAGDNYTIRIEKVGAPPDITNCYVTIMYE